MRSRFLSNELPTRVAMASLILVGAHGVLAQAPPSAAAPPMGSNAATRSPVPLSNGEERPTDGSDDLHIPALPHGKLRFEIDARDQDLLGVVKSLLNGFTGKTLRETDHTAAAREGGPSSASSSVASELDLVSSADLSSALRDITSLHLVVYEIPEKSGSGVAPPVFVHPMRKLKATILTKHPTSTTVTVKPPAPLSPLQTYEQAFASGDSRRVIMADFDDTKFTMLGFHRSHGFAAIMQAPGVVMVIRANGYPSLEWIGPAMFNMIRVFARPSRF